MAHELAQAADGTYGFAYRGAKGWHDKGQEIFAGDSLEVIQTKAHMAYELQRGKVRYATAHGMTPDAFREMPGQVVIFRSDTKLPLAVVSDRFNIVQPRQVIETFRDLSDRAGFQLETAGVLKEGRVYWAMARIGPDAIIRNKADAVAPFLLISTACDGSRATEGKYVTERVVCANTIAMAFRESDGRTSVKVSHRSIFDPEALKDQLGIARDGFSDWAKTARLLAAEPCGHDSAEQFVFEILTAKDWDKATAAVIEETRKTTGFETIMGLFNGQGKGATLDGVRGTRWGLLNSVTEYVDHHIRARSDDNRTDSAWFGNGDKLKTRAAQLLTV
jgi:phage/plasmid-like protein (TIGR03299 family)